MRANRLTAVLMALALTLPFGAPAMAANPGGGTTTTGQTLTIEITSPADGSRTNVPPGTVAVTGTAAIGPLADSGNVMYVVDVSGSTSSPSGQDCNGDGVVNGADNINGDGSTGTTLDCEIAGVLALNGSLASAPGAEAGLILFGSNAAIADVSPAGGQQNFTSPLDADVNGNTQADIAEVARSLRSTGQALLFTGKSVGTGTNFDAALNALASAFATKAGENNVAFLLSDGIGSLTAGPLSAVAAAGIKVNTYSVGGASTGCGAGAGLRQIADATGGTCTAVADPSDLSSVLKNPATVSQVTVSLNGGPAAMATLTGNDWTIGLSGLVGGMWNTIAATVTASDGTTATADIQVYGNRAPTADAGGPYIVNEGDSVVLNGMPGDPDGDMVAVTWAPAGSLSDATVATPTYTGADDAVENLTMTVSDPYGMSASDSATVTVLNVAPSLSAITAPATPTPVGTSVTASASFTDPGAMDTHTATWDWGDGSTSAGTVTEAGGNGSVADGHTYTTPGVYTITLTVTDDDGGMDTAVYEYVVVYDPNGGFVTGGGWINSPAGAYKADPSMTGRANFGFVSKYQRGATVPTGQTQFQFKAGDLNFHSTAYEWLVVAGARAQYKGTGTINGQGAYGFMLSAIDGQRPGGGGTDKLRMKIWNLSDGTIVYDNQMGDADDAAASTAIANGSIVIHQ